MNLELLFIIIPVHNRKIFTRECLLSIRNQNCKDFTIIIVDDGSTDGTHEMITHDFPEVILLKGDGNLWWTKSINLGIKYALQSNAKYILILNDDTVLEENYISKMNYWISQKKNALLGSFAYDFNTREPLYGGEIINWKTAKYNSLLDKSFSNKHTGLQRVSHYPGRGLLIPSKVFMKIGLYDEKNFPQTMADFDFTHRASRSGFEIYCNYDAILYVRTEESGDYQIRKNKTLKNYYLHLFGIKGGGNLKIFTIYALKNCPKKYLIPFLIIGILNRIFGYLIDWFHQLFFKQKNQK